MSKLPSMQFYPGDWMKDPALRAVSCGARGLWIDMLCLMWESHRRGYLVHRTGRAVTTDQLARMTGNSVDDTAAMLVELIDCGVTAQSEDGILYSRRIERDERKREKCREAGRRGGNPTLKGPVKGGSKGPPKGDSKRNPTPSSSTSSSTSYLPSEDISPTPFPDEPKPRGEPPTEFDHVTAESEFLSAWNATDGTVSYPRNALGSQLSRLFREHVTEDANWLKRASDALAKFPLPFYKSIGQPMTLKKFLEETTVDDILARKFDSSRRDNSATKGPQIRAGDRHQPGVELGAV